MIAAWNELLLGLVGSHPLYTLGTLFAVSYVAALAIPIPSYIFLAASGALAAMGSLDIASVLIVALAGNVIADITGYTLARTYGEETLHTLGFSHILESKGFTTLRTTFGEYSHSVVFTTRLITEVGPAVNLLSGITPIPFKAFLIFDLLGETVYVLIFGLAGYFLGDAWQEHTTLLRNIMIAIIALGVSLGAIQGLLSWNRKHKKRATR